MSPQFWVTQYFRKTKILKDQNTIFICNRLTVNPSVSHVSPNVGGASPIHCIHLKPTKRDPHKSIKGLQVQPIIAWMAFDFIVFGEPSLTNSYTWWNEYNFLSKSHKFRPICVPSQIATTYAPSLHCWFVFTLMSNCFRKGSDSKS